MASYFNLTLDTTAPAGVTLSINAGATYTATQTVTAAISTSDGDTTGYQMKVYGDVDPANDADVQTTEGASNWIAYSTSKSVKLSTGNALKTLNVKVRDDVGNVSSAGTDTITLDTSVPTITISVAVDHSKISKQSSFDTATFSFQSDVAIQAWKVKVVPATNSLENAGVQIPTTAGSTNVTGTSLNATTNQSVGINGTDLETASSGDGTKIIKVFGQNLAGNWSTA